MKPQRRPQTNSSLVAPSSFTASRFGCRLASRPNSDSVIDGRRGDRRARSRRRRRARPACVPRLGLRLERGHDRLPLGLGRHVAGRVVREVEQHDQLVAPLRVARRARRAKPCAVEALAGEEREGLDLRAEPHLVREPVVAPELVGQQHDVARVDEQVAGEREAVRDRAGHDRQAEAPCPRSDGFSASSFSRQRSRRLGRPAGGA